MTTLHLLNSTERSKLERCLTHYQSGDVILLINDAVYLKFAPTHNATQLRCYAIADDAKARGITLPEFVQAASYDDFVALSIECDKSISWY